MNNPLIEPLKVDSFLLMLESLYRKAVLTAEAYEKAKLDNSIASMYWSRAAKYAEKLLKRLEEQAKENYGISLDSEMLEQLKQFQYKTKECK